MNKLAVVLAAIVLAALLGIPPVIGSFTESRVIEQAQRIEDMSGNAYRIELLEYEGGWFGSTARVQAGLGEAYVEQIAAMASGDEDQFGDPAAEALREYLNRTVALVIEIGHGPILFADGLQLGLLSAVIRPDPGTQGLAELLERLDAPYLFEVRTLTGMTGTSTFTGDIPPLEMDDPNGRVSFSGFTVEGSYDFLERHIDSQGLMAFLRVDTFGFGSAIVEEFLFAADVTGFSPVLWLGEVVTEIGSLTVDGIGPDGPLNLALTQAGARFDSAVDTTGELITVEGRYYLNSLTGGSFTGDSLSGPVKLNLADASFDIAMRDFSREALEDIYAYSRLVSVSPETAPPLFPGIQDMLYLTLASSPSFEIGPLKLRWNDQPFEASLRIDVDASGLPLRQDFSMLNQRVLFDAVSAEAHADMSEDIARSLAVAGLKYQFGSDAADAGYEIPAADLENMAQTQAVGMLLGLVVQGMIETSGAGYRSDLEFVNGELSINGNVFPLGLLR